MLAVIASAASASASACDRSTHLAVPVEGLARGDLVLAAISEEGSDAITLSQVALRDGTERLEADAPTGASIVLFRLAAGSFVSIDGSAADLSTARVHLEGQPPATGEPIDAGGCGRCLIPSLSSPAVVSAGDLCPLPSFVGATAYTVTGGALARDPDTAPIERARRRIVLRWPGPCACTLTPLSGPAEAAAVPLEICPMTGLATIRPERIALAGDGTAGAFSEGFAYVVRPDGRTISRRLEPALRQIRSLATVPGPSPRFLLVSDPPQGESGADLHLFDADLERAEDVVSAEIAPRVIRDLELTVEHVARLAGSDWVQLLGRRKSGLSVVSASAECRFDPTSDAAECRPVLVEREPSCPHSFSRAPLKAAARLSGGDIVAVNEDGALLFRANGTERWLCAPEVVPPFVITPTITLARLSEPIIAASGRRLVLCGSDVAPETRGGAIAVVLTATVPPFQDLAGATSLPIRLPLTPLAIVPGEDGARCREIFLDPQRPGSLFASVAIGEEMRVFEIDAEGRVAARWAGIGGRESGADAKLYAGELDKKGDLLIEHDGWQLALTGAGELYRRPPSPAGAPRERFAPIAELDEDLDNTGFTVLTGSPEPNKVYAFRSRDRALEITRPIGSSRCAHVEVKPLARFPAPLLERGQILTASRDSRGPARFVLSGDDEEGSWIGQLDLDAGSFSVGSRPNIGVYFTDLIELSPGRFVVLARDGRLFSLSSHAGGALSPLDGDNRWLSLSAAGGVAWAGGAGALARIVPGRGGELRVESEWLARVRGQGFDRAARSSPPGITAIRALCPDQVLFAVKERYPVEALGPVLEQSAWSLGPDPSGETFVLRGGPLFEALDEAMPGNTEVPIDAFASGGTITWIYSGEDLQGPTIYRAGAPRAGAPFPVIRSEGSLGPAGIVVISGSHGRLSAIFDRGAE